MKDQNTFEDNRYWRTRSFYTSCFLLAKDQTLVNIDRVTDPKRAQFVFLETNEREFLLHQFSFAKENDPEVMVDARKFVTAIKQLKDKLYQEELR
jgi:hypothetical protein